MKRYLYMFATEAIAILSVLYHNIVRMIVLKNSKLNIMEVLTWL